MYRTVLLLCSVVLMRVAQAEPVYVEPDWLAGKLAAADVVIVDMTDDPQYLRYHIPGAIRLDYSELVMTRPADRVSLRLPEPQLYALLGRLGIQRDQHVVIYDDLAGLNAGRLFWELERIGHARVSVLRGGLVQWVLAGQRVDNREVSRRPVPYLATDSGRANEAGLQDVVQAMNGQDVVLLDVRSPEEYFGDPRAKRSGHIPGARHWPWQDSVDFAGGFVPRPAAALRASLTEVGVGASDSPVVLYCQSGHRAAQGYLTLRDLGYSRVRLYDGSMAEYARQADLPLVTGRQPR